MTLTFAQTPTISNQVATLVDLLRFRACYQANQVAYTFLHDGEMQTETITYQELDQRAQTIATHLQLINASGERALLLYPPGLDYIVAFFGCLYANVVAVPAYPPRPNHSMARLQSIFRDAQPKLALTTAAILTGLERTLEQSSELKTLTWMATDKIGETHAYSLPDLRIESQSLAFLQYTSGSTSDPKGVMISHRNLLHNLRLISQCFDHKPHHSKGVIWLPPYHDMGLIGGILAPLYAGFPLVLMSPLIFLQRPVRWLKVISQYRATTSGGPNFAYDLCVQKINADDLVGVDLSSWEVAFNGAEPIQADCLKRFADKFEPYGFRREAFYPCYGMAEATLIISGGSRSALPVIDTFDRASLEDHQVKLGSNHVGDVRKDARKLVGCGQTLPEQEIVIAHPEKLTRCQANEIGEIWVRGPSIAKGYWNQPEKTQQTFEAYLADMGAGPFMRTGDLGFIADGELYVTGRLKDLIIINGQNHYPQDIEKTVEQSHYCLRLHCSAAFSVDIKNREALVVAAEVERCYMRHQRHLLNKEAVISAIRKAIAAQHHLSALTVLLLKFGSIPKTSSGKIQRYACRRSFLQGTLATL